MINPSTPPSARTADTIGPDVRAQRRLFWWGASTFLALAVIAEATGIVVLTFEELYSSFGADLPTATRVALKGRALFWILPILAMALLGDALRRGATTHSYRLRMIAIFKSLLILSLLLVVGVGIALYLPVFRLGQQV